MPNSIAVETAVGIPRLRVSIVAVPAASRRRLGFLRWAEGA